MFRWRLRRIPSCTSSCKWRISIRSVIPGMLWRSSLVRIGPSDRRHRIVPFQRPSMIDSMASMGQAEHSFFETGISWNLDSPIRLALTSLSVQLLESVYLRYAS